jgi:hypothetical protein
LNPPKHGSKDVKSQKALVSINMTSGDGREGREEMKAIKINKNHEPG